MPIYKSLNFRRLNYCDLVCVVNLHKKCFVNFFLSKMSFSFIYVYYHCVLKYSSSICLGCFDQDNNLVGFVVGFHNPKLFYKYLYFNSFRFIIPLLSSIISNVYLLPRVFRNIQRVLLTAFNTKTSSVVFEDHIFNSNEIIELSSICIDSNFRGLGTDLLHKFISSVDQSYKFITLITDAIDNDKVNHFYLKNNFICYKKVKRDARFLNYYFYSI